MKSLHCSCRMRKRKFPMIVIRVASPHFLSAPSTRRTHLLWIFARQWKLSWKPPGRSRTTICPIRISTNFSLVFSVSVRMACLSCKKRRPSSKAPASKNICDYISNTQNKETLCFFVFFVFSYVSVLSTSRCMVQCKCKGGHSV